MNNEKSITEWKMNNEKLKIYNMRKHPPVGADPCVCPDKWYEDDMNGGFAWGADDTKGGHTGPPLHIP